MDGKGLFFGEKIKIYQLDRCYLVRLLHIKIVLWYLYTWTVSIQHPSS